MKIKLKLFTAFFLLVFNVVFSQNNSRKKTKTYLTNEKDERVSEFFDFIGDFNLYGFAQFYNNLQPQSEYATSLDNEIGIINRKGEIILPMEYRFHSYVPNGISIVSKGGKMGLYSILTGEKYGLMTAKGEIILPTEYDKIVRFNSSFLIKKDKWAVFDEQLKNLSGFIYDHISSPIDDYGNQSLLTSFRKNSKWGFLNEKGEEVLPCKFTSCTEFDIYGNAKVSTNGELQGNSLGKDKVVFGDSIYINCKFGLINQKGDYILEERFDRVDKFYNEGLGYEIESNGNVGAIDISGKTILPCEFQEIEFLSQEKVWITKKNDKYGLVDFTNNQLIKCEYAKIKSIGSSRFLVNQGGVFNYATYSLEGGKYGIINIKGKKILSVDYDFLEIIENSISDNAESRFFFKKAGKYGLMNESFDIIVKPKYDTIEYYNYESLLKVSLKSNSADIPVLYGIIDFDGKVVAPIEYESIDSYPYFNSPVRVKKNGKYGYFNYYGENVIPFIYDEAERFENELAKVCIYDASMGKKCGVINLKNEYVISPNYKIDSFEKLNGKNIIVQKDNNYGVLNTNGEEIIPVVNTYIWRVNNTDFFIANSQGFFNLEANVIEGGKFSLLNEYGDTILPPIYSHISALDGSSKFLYVSKNDKEYGLFNLEKMCLVLPEMYTTCSVNDFDKNRFTVSQGGTVNEEGYLANGKYGVVDENNSIIIPIEYDLLGSYNEYFIAHKNNLQGIIDLNGKPIVPIEYDEIDFIDYRLIKLGKGTNPVSENFVYGAGKYALYDSEGKSILTSFAYENFYDMGSHLVYKKDNLNGLMDKSGREISAPLFSGFEAYSLEGTFIFSKYQDGVNLFGVLDLNGKELIPFEYENIAPEKNYFLCIKNGVEIKISRNNQILKD